jgi:hypothetical protein
MLCFGDSICDPDDGPMGPKHVALNSINKYTKDLFCVTITSILIHSCRNHNRMQKTNIECSVQLENVCISNLRSTTSGLIYWNICTKNIHKLALYFFPTVC